MKEALKGTLRLKANEHWIRRPYAYLYLVNTRGNLTNHTTILDRILNIIPWQLITYILTFCGHPKKVDCKEVEPINYNINCHTDAFKLDDNRTGAGVLINNSHNDIAEKAIHLGNNATVFQTEVFAVEIAASHLIFAETKNKSVVINCNNVTARPQLWLLKTQK